MVCFYRLNIILKKRIIKYINLSDDIREGKNIMKLINQGLIKNICPQSIGLEDLFKEVPLIGVRMAK